MIRTRSFSVLALSIFSIACSAAPLPTPVALADLPKASLAEGQPILLALHRGDVVPLDVKVDGQYVRTRNGEKGVDLEIVRDVWLLVGEDGIRASFDGTTFGDPIAPGQFSFGIGATRERGSFASFTIRPPTLAEPSSARAD